MIIEKKTNENTVWLIYILYKYIINSRYNFTEDSFQYMQRDTPMEIYIDRKYKQNREKIYKINEINKL